jgi:hypothetical protein
VVFVHHLFDIHFFVNPGPGSAITMMKVVQRISESDNQELQDSYNLCSSWTRHDQDMALNYSPPSLDDLERELERVHSWHKRIKGYRNNSGPDQ